MCVCVWEKGGGGRGALKVIVNVCICLFFILTTLAPPSGNTHAPTQLKWDLAIYTSNHFKWMISLKSMQFSLFSDSLWPPYGQHGPDINQAASQKPYVTTSTHHSCHSHWCRAPSQTWVWLWDIMEVNWAKRGSVRWPIWFQSNRSRHLSSTKQTFNQ